MLYIGNGKYCYANSAAMLLSSINEMISPSVIEVLTGVSLGATIHREELLLYFNNQTLQPDLGITQALKLLGFESTMRVSDSTEDFPINDLKAELHNGPVIIGPLNMGHLTYNPIHEYLFDADHFVLVYAVDKDRVYLHDPAEFPHVWLSINDLKLSWQAKNIFYRRGYYRYIFAPRRIDNPGTQKIYKDAMDYFKDIYKNGIQKTDKTKVAIGREAIMLVANKAKKDGLTKREIDHFVYFALPLGAKRALDYATFFESHNKALSELKGMQAKLFGESHSLVMTKDWIGLSKSLEKLAEAEEDFQEILLGN